jgi:hypothetical protein
MVENNKPESENSFTLPDTPIMVASLIVKGIKKKTSAKDWKEVCPGDQIVLYMPFDEYGTTPQVKYLIIPQDATKEVIEGCNSLNQLAIILNRTFIMIQIN